jgi:flagellar biosynthesis/type III secretory pathway protein FliH
MRQSQQVLEWQAEARAEGLAEGKAEGQADGQKIAVIAFLEARFQSVSAGLVESIRSISDLQRLTALLPLAAKAASLDQFRLDAGL